jgi:uncharacterized membrane protein YjfL (UPF0719 family)
LDEVAEIRKGNGAVGVVLGSVVLATGLVVREAMRPSYDALVLALSPNGRLIEWAATTALHVSLALAAATVGVVVGSRTFAALVGDDDPFEQLRAGNIAHALVLAGVISVTGALIAEATGPLLDALVPYPSAVRVKVAGEQP